MAFGNFEPLYAVVVWFHPTEKEYQTLSLYKEDVTHVIVVDNSETDNRSLLRNDPRVTYIPLMQNFGIAAALNRGCEEAQKAGAQWVLTMDQDSRWDQQSVQEYIEEAAQYGELDKVAIFSPYHDCDGTPDKHHRYGRFETREVVMCSGNLLRLEAWQQVNGFREDFFIDLVDDEICCHVRQFGWLVVRTNNIILSHRLGNGVKYVRFTKHPYTPHPAWRYFYIARNIHRMLHLYPELQKYYRKQVKKYIKRICLYDNEDKFHKLREFLRGWYTD
ncbi:MAG: glycosyltransferase [Paludibacteraceae bacterium]|nr:glycosyltransferase [Paludibacteraceae bacterium]